MKKKLISTALAAVTAFSTVSALNTNAIHCWGTLKESEIDEQLADWTKIEENYELFSVFGSQQTTPPDLIYFRHTIDPRSDSDVFMFLTLERQKDCIYITFPAFFDIDTFEEKISDISEELNISILPTNGYEVRISISNPEINIEILKKIRHIAGDTTTSFVFYDDNYWYQEICAYSMAGFSFSYDSKVDDERNVKLQEYLDENNIEAEVYVGMEDWETVLKIEPQKDLTPLERIEFANEIYLASGYSPFFTGNESSSSKIKNLSYDLTDYLNGDANCDRKYSIADSTAILQALGNPDKYGLSDLGLFNADSTGNGLTVEDAVAIKTALAKGL